MYGNIWRKLGIVSFPKISSFIKSQVFYTSCGLILKLFYDAVSTGDII